MIRRNFVKKATLAGAAISAFPSQLFRAARTQIFNSGNVASEQQFQFNTTSTGSAIIVPGETTIVPVETDDILSNPGMGWETSRLSTLDKNLPSWIPSRVRYMRWGWDRFEPAKGQIDTVFLENIFRENREAGQTLAFRVMTAYPGRRVYPLWLQQTGGKILHTPVFIDNENSEDTEVPDLDDPVILETHLDFIKRLGHLYDGHPGIDHIDLGSVGWWGEWHLSDAKTAKMPSTENLKKVIDAYLEAFKKTPLLMLIGASRTGMLQYATERGAGWRADCFGDMDYHMTKYYTQALESNNALDAWKKGPVAWETCWDIRKWVSEKWPLRFIFNYGLALHGSLMTDKSAPIPEGAEVRDEIERFLRRLGYRFILKELKHASQVKAGENLELLMKWQNKGSAPCYRPYKLAFKLSADSEGREDVKKFTGLTSVNHWMPGDMKFDVQEYIKNPVDLPEGQIYDVREVITIPASLKPGKYILFTGVTDGMLDNGEASQPIVNLGIRGKTNDGWYRLSEINII